MCLDMELDSRGKYIKLTGREWREARMSQAITFDAVPDDQLVPLGIRANEEGITEPLARINEAAAQAAQDIASGSLAAFGLFNRLRDMADEMQHLAGSQTLDQAG